MKPITLTLTLTVTYNPNGVDLNTLKQNLIDVADHAASQGLLTGESAAEVDEYGYAVKVKLPASAKAGTPEHAEFVESLQEVADEVGGEIRSAYSGRGMMGNTCYGIVAEDVNELQRAAARLGLPLGRIDSMGMDGIVYWPGYEGEDNAGEE